MKKIGQPLFALIALATLAGCSLLDMADKPLTATNRIGRAWNDVEASLNRCNRMIPQLTAVTQGAAIADQNYISAQQRVIAARNEGFFTQPIPPQTASPEQVNAYMNRRDGLVGDAIMMATMMRQSQTSSPTIQINPVQMQSQQLFNRLFDEITGCENRIATALHDYGVAVEEQQNVVGSVYTGWAAHLRHIGSAQQRNMGTNPTVAPTINMNFGQPAPSPVAPAPVLPTVPVTAPVAR